VESRQALSAREWQHQLQKQTLQGVVVGMAGDKAWPNATRPLSRGQPAEADIQSTTYATG
jgi:hypothetical protein